MNGSLPPVGLDEVTKRRLLSRIGSLGLALAALWLVAFHVALFWRRIADATIQQPGVLARWIASALLIAGALIARRYALRHWHRRHTTVVFWLLVLLLHVSIPAEERLLGYAEIFMVVAEAGLGALPILLAAVLLSIGTIILRIAFAAATSTAAVRLQLLSSLSTPRAPPAL